MLDWFKRNVYEINFFIAGWCAMACIDSIGKGDYVWAAVNGGLCYLNIKLARS